MSLSAARSGVEVLREILHPVGSGPDLALLETWPGWGVLAPALSLSPEGAWTQVADDLESVLAEHPDWLRSGREATDTSFYTPPWLAQMMADLLVGLGFTEGRVLEPGCGSGQIMASALPGASWTGVESDPASAALAKALHPHATILASPLEKVELGTGAFDAVLANVPFSTTAPYDPIFHASSLHEYFLLRALHAVKVGGYVIAITSRHTVDGVHSPTRLTEMADLHAIRLPSGTFPGTSAVADLLILRRVERRELGDVRYSGGGSHRNALVLGEGWRKVEVSPYWREFPDHIAGTMELTGYQPAPIRVVSQDPEADVARALAKVAPLLAPLETGVADWSLPEVALTDESGRKENSFHLEGSDLVRIQGGVALPVRNSKELRLLVTLRDEVLALLATDAEHSHLTAAHPDHDSAQRARVRQTYLDYVAAFGPLSRGVLHEGTPDPETGEASLTWKRPTLGGFRGDPDYMTVLGIERYDPEAQTSEPAPVLLRPVHRAPEPVTHAESPSAALAISLGETRSVDLTRIASLLGLPSPEAARLALGNLVYPDPARGGNLVGARDLLSGDIRQKLALAQSAALADPELYQDAADALRDAMPSQADISTVRPTLGAPWVPGSVVGDFAEQVLGSRVQATLDRSIARWEVSDWSGRGAMALDYRTADKDPSQVLSAILNGRALTVYDEEWDSSTRRSRKVRNAAATLAAEEAASAMRAAFDAWVFLDPDRTQLLLDLYNVAFRSHAPRASDPNAVSIPGVADGIEMWDHQKAIVERIVSAPRTLCGHTVGAGKTKSMVATAMTLRGLGLANRPMIAVPGHLLEQIAAEAQQTFPAGRFLIAGKEDLAKGGRRLFAARCATGDWDAVIITHEAFGSIPVSAEAELDYLAQAKDEVYAVAREQGVDWSSAKKIAAATKKATARITELRSFKRDPDALVFEQLGIDFLAVDELHLYRRLAVGGAGGRSDNGSTLGSSKRATDLHLKVELLGRQRGDKPHFAGFTGTVWSNTLAETFVWQTFFAPDRLRQVGMSALSTWAAMFVEVTTAVEVAPDGSGFRMHRRPSKVRNVPALMSMVGEFLDLLPEGALQGQIPLGRRHTESVGMDGEQKEFVGQLVERADRLRAGGSKENMLTICNDGRRVALDPALVGLEGQGSKIEKAAAQIAKRFHADTEVTLPGAGSPGTFQLVLCDQGTPGEKGPQTYGRLRDALIRQGVPGQAIRFVHDATTDKARAALFAACRNGSIRVLVGSTRKVGMGTNVQTRLVALHHLDAPWLPAEVEQREGRALRPYNLSSHVDIYRYVTEGSFDAYMWQALERKMRFIDALMNSRASESGDLEDIGEVVLSYSQVKAAAAGDERLIEQASLVAQVRRLSVLRSQHGHQVEELRKKADSLKLNASRHETQAKWLTQAPNVAACDLEQAMASVLAGFKKDPRRSYGHRARAGALELSAIPHEGMVSLTIAGPSYSTLWRMPLSPKDVRRPDLLVAKAKKLWMGRHDEASELRVSSSAKREEAQSLIEAADASTFARQAELGALRDRLARLESEFAREAEERLMPALTTAA